jgi:hypothetical protein
MASGGAASNKPFNWRPTGRIMSNFQAMVLGAMVSWTPSLIVLAYFLLRAPLIDSEEVPMSSPLVMDDKSGATSPHVPLGFDPVET